MVEGANHEIWTYAFVFLNGITIPYQATDRNVSLPTAAN
jgi:hypothetical protein